MDKWYEDIHAITAGNERAQRELRRVLDNLDKLPEQQSAAELLPLDEMEERLEIINELENHWCPHFAWLTQKSKENCPGISTTRSFLPCFIWTRAI